MKDLTYQQVIDRLDRDEALAPDVVDCVLAAAEGAETLVADRTRRRMP